MDSENTVWLIRTIFGILIGANAFFLARTARALDKATEKIIDHETRLSVVELLVEQHEKELDRLGLSQLVRRRFQDELELHQSQFHAHRRKNEEGFPDE